MHATVESSDIPHYIRYTGSRKDDLELFLVQTRSLNHMAAVPFCTITSSSTTTPLATMWAILQQLYSWYLLQQEWQVAWIDRIEHEVPRAWSW